VAGIGECRFCYPVSHPTEFLTLRSPEFGNRDRLEFNRISRETRGGTLVVFADPIWPKIETMALTFTALTSAQVQAYLTFVKDHLGLEVGFVDWEGFYWKGVIQIWCPGGERAIPVVSPAKPKTKPAAQGRQEARGSQQEARAGVR